MPTSISTVGALNGVLTVTITDLNGVDYRASISFSYTTNFEYLSMFSATSYPLDTDTWVIDDIAATTADFAGLSAAIQSLSNDESTRKIKLEFPNLEAIPDYAIFGESEYNSISTSVLTSVSSSKATNIGDYAFGSCMSLTSVNFPSALSIGDYSFHYCVSLLDISAPSVLTIGEYAFRDCFAVETFSFPSATSIGNIAFGTCRALTTVDLPLVTSVGRYAFHYCSSLVDIELPLTISFGDSVFYDCTSLKTVSLPSIVSIGYSSFIECPLLDNVKLATNSGVLLNELGYESFPTPANVDLTVGAANASLISDNTITVGDYSYTFKSITVLSE
ncbi:MAG: leucine-rich repeat domain-containing protein [Rikenellaceae bacterium]